jgi:tRNA_anti-like
MKSYIKIALFAIFFIALSGIWFALHLYNLKHPDMAKTKPDFVITASVLEKAFEDNEIAASKIYINKILEVTGTVASVKPADNNVLSISLATGSDLSSVICTFTAVTDTSKFRTGYKINLRGECSGFLMDVLLNNCALIQ